MWRPVALVTVGLIVVTGCGGQDGSTDPDVPTAATPTTSRAAPTSSAPTTAAPEAPSLYPGREWKRAESGDWADLDATLARDGSTCIAVIKDGRLVHDAYWNGGGQRVPQKVYSITKSLTSLLVGMHDAAGKLDLDAPAAEHVPAWRRSDARAVTPRSLLAMTSGRYWDESVDRQLISVAGDKSAYAVGQRQERPPGEQWRYDNAATQVLEAVLQDAAGTADVASLAQRRLVDPLGMTDTTWERDAAGNALTFSGVRSTCHDLARVGHLMLNRGAWDGRQLVPADYVRAATTPSSDLNAAYGLLWWTNAQGRIVEVLRQAGFTADKAPYQGRLAPDVPTDAYWAFGYGNQYLAVVPSEGIVAVRLGARPATPDRVTFDSFTAGVLRALDR